MRTIHWYLFMNKLWINVCMVFNSRTFPWQQKGMDVRKSGAMGHWLQVSASLPWSSMVTTAAQVHERFHTFSGSSQSQKEKQIPAVHAGAAAHDPIPQVLRPLLP